MIADIFLETYGERDFFVGGLKMRFVQDNQSKSTKEVLRGLHFRLCIRREQRDKRYYWKND